MRRGVAVAIVATAVIVVGGAGVGAWLLTRPAGPDATAAAYLDALTTGDGPRAASLLADPGDADALARAFGAAAARITDAHVSSTRTDGADAVADVAFTLDGAVRTAEVTLSQRDGGWFIGPDGLGTVTATAPLGAAAAVADVSFGLGVARTLLPAEYTVTAAPNQVLTGSAAATVLPGAAVSVDVPAALSADATAIAQRQLDGYEDACTASAATVPDHCGLRVPWAADLASLSQIAFRIEQRPTLVLSADGRTFAATGGIIVATASGTTPAGATQSFTYRADDWALRGAVTFTADAMTLAAF